MDSDRETVKHRNVVSEKNKHKFHLDSDDSQSENPTKLIRKLGRHNSVSNAEATLSGDARLRRCQPDHPIHSPRDSILSMSDGFSKFDGIVNNCLLILFLGSSRLLLENVIKYGLRVNPLDWLLYVIQSSRDESYYATPLWLLASNFHLIFVLQLEKLLSKGIVSSIVGFWIHVLDLTVVIGAPWIAFWFWPNSFSLMGRMLICTLHILLFMKIWSFVHVNHWCREAKLQAKKMQRGRSFSYKAYKKTSIIEEARSSGSLVSYPHNLSLRDLYYFMAAPTLCYELNFPRTDRIRKWFLFRRACEVLLLSNLVLASFQQFIIPTVTNSMKPFSEMDHIRCGERLLKLALPNHALWVVWFYLVFHSFLNITGELMMFADRKFYGAWWNAPDVGTFWRLWNLPVHNWCLRHLFRPCLRAGVSKPVAGLLVFGLSAFLHEYLVSVPLCMHKIMVFAGMALQIPLIAVSASLSKRWGWQWGNLLLWSSLILGQPLGMLVYFHDYVVLNLDITQFTS